MSSENALTALRSAAKGGAPAALTALGLALLKQEGAARDEGLGHVVAAAQRGDGEAHALLATFAAGGVAREPSWDDALDHLRVAAEAGWAPSQRELRFLAGAEGSDWDALRRQVDVEAWLGPPRPRVVAETPRIAVIDGFLPPAARAWFIERARASLSPASVYREDAEGQRMAKERTNSEFSFDLFNADVAVCLLQARIEAATGLAVEQFETLTLMHYAPGQQFEPHHDFLSADQPGQAENIRKRGQRVATFLVYLNDDFTGGETEFPQIGFTFKGKAGDALLFSNVNPAGQPEPKSLHAGRPVIAGEKWLLSQWVRNRPQGW